MQKGRFSLCYFFFHFSGLGSVWSPNAVQMLQSFDEFFVKLRAYFVTIKYMYMYFRCVISCTSGVRKTCQVTSAKNCIFKNEDILFTIFFHFSGYVSSQTSQKAVLKSEKLSEIKAPLPNNHFKGHRLLYSL